MKILVAVDGSKPSLKAVQLLVEHCDWYRSAPEVELVTVHLPVPKLARMGAAVGKDQIERYYKEEGEAMLAAARKKLDAAGVPYQSHILVGPVAEAIVKHANDKRCDLIYIGTHGRSALGKALIGSTATKVLHISDLPVLLVK
jgi:nucleotide-binding universal stress UspA family protein